MCTVLRMGNFEPINNLIGFKTISGEDNSTLIDYCDEILKKLGATSFRTFDDDKKRVNLFATLKAKNSKLDQFFFRGWWFYQNVTLRVHACFFS